MSEFLIEHDSFTGFILTMYLLIIPMLCNMAWQDSKISYIKWYFTKGDYINYLGFGIFIIISSGSFIWYLALLFLKLIVYIILNPLVWLIEFIFFNKDCSNIISEELIEKERQREDRYKKREYEIKLAKYVGESPFKFTGITEIFNIDVSAQPEFILHLNKIKDSND